jgi:hypothetical protein
VNSGFESTDRASLPVRKMPIAAFAEVETSSAIESSLRRCPASARKFSRVEGKAKFASSSPVSESTASCDCFLPRSRPRKSLGFVF